MRKCKIPKPATGGRVGAMPHIWSHVHSKEHAEITGYNDGFIRNVCSCLRRSQAEFESGELSCCHASASNLVLVVY